MNCTESKHCLTDIALEGNREDFHQKKNTNLLLKFKECRNVENGQ